MLALSIRQPYAEEILRGLKTVEYRRFATQVIGERFYIYAPREPADGEDIAERFAKLGCQPGELPTGVIVGTAVIDKCSPDGGTYEWSLTDVQRLAKPRKPARHPQPGWFKPF